MLQARAGVKDIDLRLGDAFQPNFHRAVGFTPLADVVHQLDDECKCPSCLSMRLIYLRTNL